jgi:AcrR family transcriptional regulator
MTVIDRAPTRLTRGESRAQTRQRLVDAAMRVFARAGYAGASVNTIAAEAGYTVGALYSNFASKDELFWAAFEQHCARDLAALDALVTNTANWDELMVAITERFADLDEEHREWWALWAELWLYGQRHPETAHRLAAVQDDTRSVIARALEREGHGSDSELVATVHALWTGFMLYRLSDPDAIDSAAFGRAAAQLVTTKTSNTIGGTS